MDLTTGLGSCLDFKAQSKFCEDKGRSATIMSSPEALVQTAASTG